MSNFSLISGQTGDNIIALATPQGSGAIAVLRISGADAIDICNAVFRGKNLGNQASHTAHFGTIRKDNGEIIDEVLLTIFRAPKSYTGENLVEISCHGSPYIVRSLVELFHEKGVRYAQPGEFTRRAFLNGKMDLAQAEAVADLIASETAAAHKSAMTQMKGGFSKEIRDLREQLLNFAALIELELDFGEEDVEFAERGQLYDLISKIESRILPLLESFKMGNVIKNGVPVVIAGKPNAGKSTLLNALLNEEKAIVSDVPGTTRDFIEDEMIIRGVAFRFIDTAGLRKTEDKIEQIGVERAKNKMQTAELVIYLIDLSGVATLQDWQNEIAETHSLRQSTAAPFILVGNKSELADENLLAEIARFSSEAVFISALQKDGIEKLIEEMFSLVEADNFLRGDTTITNARHFENLDLTRLALQSVRKALDERISGELLAYHLREALQKLGEITGEITNDEILGSIFSKFCIGK